MLALADVDQRADDVAHHMVQERVRAQHEVDARAARLDLERVKRAHRRLRLALGGAERGEVVLADEVRRGLPHLRRIERQVKPAQPGRAEPRPHVAVEELIAVSP